MVKVMVHPADEGGTGCYRLIWPGEALRSQGHDVTVAFDHTYKARWQPSAIGPDRIIGLAEEVESDVVIVQRPLQRDRLGLIEALQAQGVVVVVEVDDDFHAVHKRNMAWRSTNPLTHPDMNRDWLMRACEQADLVTVSTPALAQRYGAHGRVRVLPNCVPERYLAFAAEPDGPLRVGWSGSVATHPADLQQAGDGIARAVRDAGARFSVVGTGVGVRDRLGLDDEPEACGWLPIGDYPAGLARFDVGIVPLLPSPFNEAKSWLKGLEFAAVGVPFVATPTGEYRALAELGAGLLAETPDAWYRLVSALLASVDLRAEHAERGRAVAAELTVERNAGAWIEAWSSAVRVAA